MVHNVKRTLRVESGEGAGSCRAPDFEDFSRRRRSALLRSARRMVQDPMDAEDLLQMALLSTYQYWDGIADKSLAYGYVRRVMINTRTARWRARRLEEIPTDQLPDSGVDDSSQRLGDRAVLMGLLAALPTGQRSIVVLRVWEQLSVRETAQMLGVSDGTVKSALHRGLERMRQEIEVRGGADRFFAGLADGGVRASRR